MSKPIIAVDVDDVLFPYVIEAAKYHNALKGTHLTIDDFHTYHFMEVLGCTEDEATEIAYAVHRADSSGVLPMEGTTEALSELAQRYELHVVTSRPGLFEQKTCDWLERHFPGVFTRVHVVGNPYDGSMVRSKAEVCLELGSSCLIDDQPKYVLPCAEKGVRCILFGDYPWNRHAELPEGVTRCRDWPAVLEYFNKVAAHV